MRKAWPMVSLSEILSKSHNWINIEPAKFYKQITVRLWGQGVVLRNEVKGAEISSLKRIAVKPKEFIVSRIDARNGAFGLIPDFLSGAVVSTDFPVFVLNHSFIIPEFLEWMSKTQDFVRFCVTASEGTTNRVRLKEDRFLSSKIPVPHLSEQQRIVAKIEELAEKIKEASSVKKSIAGELNQLLLSVFNNLVSGGEFQPMSEVAPITRRPVKVNVDGEYPELGIRSFGKGTFHKPSLTGFDVGTKKLYRIEPEDLVFNNVFAWEGAVAVAKREDIGRVGSHRFMTCVPKNGMVTPNFLCFYFLTREGTEKLGGASPGGAGRNRTLGLEALSKITVPILPIEKQIWFDKLQMMANSMKSIQTETQKELDALMPSILDKAFKGEL